MSLAVVPKHTVKLVESKGDLCILQYRGQYCIASWAEFEHSQQTGHPPCTDEWMPLSHARAALEAVRWGHKGKGKRMAENGTEGTQGTSIRLTARCREIAKREGASYTEQIELDLLTMELLENMAKTEGMGEIPISEALDMAQRSARSIAAARKRVKS